MKLSMRHATAIFTILATATTGIIATTSNAYAADVSISTCSQLAAIDDDPAVGYSDTYLLENDIVCGEFSSLKWDQAFTGTFDGQGHRILGLDVFNSSNQHVGLFSTANGATLKDLNLDAGTVTGEYNVGALVGTAAGDMVIDNVHSSLTINGSQAAGGLLGVLDSAGSAVSSLTGSSSTGEVNGKQYVGGLIGIADLNDSQSTTIQTSWATGVVNAEGFGSSTGVGAGGLIGMLSVQQMMTDTELIIQDSYATGDVIAPNVTSVGGLIGDMGVDVEFGAVQASIINTYATGNVQGNDAGGLIGGLSVRASTTIENSLAVGAVSGTGDLGGLIGYFYDDNNDMVITNSYWNVNTSGQSGCINNGAFAGCTGQTLALDDYLGNFDHAPMSSWSPNGEPWFTSYGGFPVVSDDVDHDGISNDIENAATAFNDANDDGIRDSEQQNVVSFNNPLTGNYVTIQTPPGILIFDQSIEDGSAFDTQDAGLTYPGGFLNFTAYVGVSNRIDINLYYGDAHLDEEFQIRKYSSQTQTYSAVELDTNEIVDIGDTLIRHIEYSAQDGGDYDDDGIQNGLLVDPIGIAVAAPAAPATTTTSKVIPAPDVNAAAGALPSTGSTTRDLVLVALLVLVSGCALTATQLTKRRRRAS